ncbi:ATP-binding cassette domain-containing protein [Sporosarcina sp. CAU 1771]
MKVVEFNNVTKSYGRRSVLNDMNFSIEEGIITGMIGRNGVGKTTLMKIIAGHIKETSGIVNVFSEQPFNSLKVSANSIFIDDTMSFSDKLTLQDIFKEAARFYPNWDALLAEKLLTYFRLFPKGPHNQLSKGQMNTFNAIIGIAARCPLTIFDEPTTGMDTAVRKDFYRALLKDYIAHPRTILLSSHHLDEIEDLLENILLVNNGVARFHGPITELQEMFVKLSGSENTIRNYIAEKNVFARQSTGPYYEATVEDTFTKDEKLRMKDDGIKIFAVPANEAYVSLTSNSKGGIDDVFD